MSRKISQAGLKLIKSFEGCRLTAYKPVPTETYWTIGWGHYGPDVRAGMTITQAQADAMLASDLGKYESYVNNPNYVPVTKQLNQYQFDALVSFCYNCGSGNLRSLCKGRTVDQIGANITKYNKSSGTVLAGLVRRRNAELDLYNAKETKETKESEEAMEKAKVYVNDKKIEDGFVLEGRVYVPLRAAGEAFGAKVNWDNDKKIASLTK